MVRYLGSQLYTVRGKNVGGVARILVNLVYRSYVCMSPKLIKPKFYLSILNLVSVIIANMAGLLK